MLEASTACPGCGRSANCSLIKPYCLLNLLVHLMSADDTWFSGLRGLDQRCQFVERHPPAGFVVGGRDARRKIVMYAEHIRTAICLRECERDRHFAAQGRIIARVAFT